MRAFLLWWLRSRVRLPLLCVAITAACVGGAAALGKAGYGIPVAGLLLLIVTAVLGGVRSADGED